MGLGIYEAGTGMTRRSAGRGGRILPLSAAILSSRESNKELVMLVRQQNPHGACRLPICRFGCPRWTREASRVSTPDSCQTHTGETSVPTSRPESLNPDVLTGLADIAKCHGKEARGIGPAPRDLFSMLQGTSPDSPLDHTYTPPPDACPSFLLHRTSHRNRQGTAWTTPPPSR